MEHFTVNGTRLGLWEGKGSSKNKTKDSLLYSWHKSGTSDLGHKWMQIFSRHSATILWACMSDQDSYQKPKWHRKVCHGSQASMHCFPQGFHDLLGGSPSYCH